VTSLLGQKVIVKERFITKVQSTSSLWTLMVQSIPPLRLIRLR